MGRIIKLTFRDYSNILEKLSKTLQKSKYSPDVIIGVFRGGLPTALYFSHYFNAPLGILKVIAHKSNVPFSERKLEKPKVLYLPRINGKRVLIVEDTVGTGKTMSSVLRIIKPKKPKTIKTLALFTEINKNTPDFYHKIIKSDEWVVFPWEKKK